MKLEEIPPLYRHTWAVYEALRKLGFEDDDITYRSAPVALRGDGTDTAAKVTPEEYLGVVLTTQGKLFTAIIGPLDRPFAEAQALWKQIRQGIKDGTISDETMQTMWAQSRMADVEHFASLTGALLGQGIVIPGLAKKTLN